MKKKSKYIRQNNTQVGRELLVLPNNLIHNNVSNVKFKTEININIEFLNKNLFGNYLEFWNSEKHEKIFFFKINKNKYLKNILIEKMNLLLIIKDNNNVIFNKKFISKKFNIEENNNDFKLSINKEI